MRPNPSSTPPRRSWNSAPARRWCLPRREGPPSVVERAFVLPPASRLGPLTAQERGELIRGSAVYGRYEKVVDRESAYEMLKGRAAESAEAAGAPEVKKEEGGGIMAGRWARSCSAAPGRAAAGATASCRVRPRAPPAAWPRPGAGDRARRARFDLRRSAALRPVRDSQGAPCAPTFGGPAAPAVDFCRAAYRRQTNCRHSSANCAQAAIMRTPICRTRACPWTRIVPPNTTPSA